MTCIPGSKEAVASKRGTGGLFTTTKTGKRKQKVRPACHSEDDAALLTVVAAISTAGTCSIQRLAHFVFYLGSTYALTTLHIRMVSATKNPEKIRDLMSSRSIQM